MSGIDMSFVKLTEYAKLPEFQKFIRKVFAELKTELNVDLNEILNWLNTEIREADVFETKTDLKYPLYEYGFPCWVKKFRDMYDIQVDDYGVIIAVVGDTIWIGTFEDFNLRDYGVFDVFSFLKSLRCDYDGTVAIMKNILSAGGID